MGHCVRLVLPDVPNDPITQRFIEEITGRWGGLTMFTGRGLWKSDNTGLVCGDNVIVIEVSIGPWTDNVREWWFDLADRARELLDEECVFLSVRSETAWFIGHDGMGPTDQEITGP